MQHTVLPRLQLTLQCRSRCPVSSHWGWAVWPRLAGGAGSSAIRAQPKRDAHAVLQVARGSSRAEVRAAYLALIKALHPDVNPDSDTTADAATLNAAYAELMEGVPWVSMSL
jgi:hypothetical protein